MKISLIAAAGKNGVIGSRGKIPWHLPADFKRFKELTMGHPIIMGRKTFESIGKPLPGRMNIVITGDADYAAPGCIVAHSFDDALRLTGDALEVFAIGGASVYTAALPKADTVYLTRVHADFEGDAFFPKYNEQEWQLVSSEDHTKDEKNPFDFTFLTYERRVQA